MIQISFIIPVYNSAPFLEKCLHSVMDQGLSEEEFEIILIDDGSTDSSPDICRRFESAYPMIHLIRQENKGVSEARNRGIFQASGKYIVFIDSDDYLNKGGFGALLKAVQGRNADMIRFWMQILEEGEIGDGKATGEVLFDGHGFAFIKDHGIDTFSIPFLYGREWLLKSGICFQSFPIAEDYLFVSELMLRNPHLISTSFRIYNYVKHPSSITGDRTRAHTASCARGFVDVIDSLFRYSGDHPSHDPVVEERLLQSAQDKMRSFISRVLSSDIKPSEFRQMVLKLKRMEVLPVKSVMNGGTVLQRMTDRIINLLADYPSFIPPVRLVYRHVFMPFFYSKFKKN